MPKRLIMLVPVLKGSNHTHKVICIHMVIHTCTHPIFQLNFNPACSGLETKLKWSSICLHKTLNSNPNTDKIKKQKNKTKNPFNC
jgi:hypothetical protein